MHAKYKLQQLFVNTDRFKGSSQKKLLLLVEGKSALLFLYFLSPPLFIGIDRSICDCKLAIPKNHLLVSLIFHAIRSIKSSTLSIFRRKRWGKEATMKVGNSDPISLDLVRPSRPGREASRNARRSSR